MEQFTEQPIKYGPDCEQLEILQIFVFYQEVPRVKNFKSLALVGLAIKPHLPKC